MSETLQNGVLIAATMLPNSAGQVAINLLCKLPKSNHRYNRIDTDITEVICIRVLIRMLSMVYSDIGGKGILSKIISEVAVN